MKVLAFAATTSSTSINRALLGYATARLEAIGPPEIEIEFLKLADYEMPIYSSDREKADGVPTAAKALFDKIGSVDALMISYAEHNGSVTAAWKNTFDWMTRIDTKVWHDKPMVLLAATPGPRSGAGVLGNQQTLIPFFGGVVKGVYGVGKWYEAWDAEAGTLTDADAIAGIDAALSGLAAPASA
ncbi:MAG: NAD(P)H-dependent oxidoreductase [Pseudomonadota bacterium]